MKYIASMTTYPERFRSALDVIRNINTQSIKPKALVINISQEDWKKAELDFIHQAKFLFSNHLIIKPCVNLRPANKIIPTAKEYGDNIIITFDDDVAYPRNRAEELLNKHKEFPQNPIAYRTRKVLFKGEDVIPYSQWSLSYDSEGPNGFNFPTSVSGSLYPKNFFASDFFDTEKYVRLSYTNDDIWTYFHVLKQGSSFVRGGIEMTPPSVKGSQNSALWKTNVSQGGNDKIISDMELEYGKIFELIK